MRILPFVSPMDDGEVLGDEMTNFGTKYLGGQAMLDTILAVDLVIVR